MVGQQPCSILAALARALLERALPIWLLLMAQAGVVWAQERRQV
jgi:hypothetical protein